MKVQRNLANAVKCTLEKYPILAITGPRQSGKTTFLKEVLPQYRYISLENPDARSYAETDPKGFLEKYDKYVIFDEVQRVPALFSYLQGLVDESGLMGQYVLSGSQNFHLMKNITQSLAGRVALFRLFPFDNSELTAAGLLDESSYFTNMIRGFYPAIYNRDIPSRQFYQNYVQTYVQRDITELINIRDMRLFQNFVALCATRAGQLLNLSALANECGISQPTAKAWLSTLENSYIIFQLYPYYRNFSKRIVKTPKLYFYDTGLLCYLLKISSPELLALHGMKGNLFENMMIAEYIKQMYHYDSQQDIYFWRDSGGNEVDLLIENSGGFHLTEFKASKTVMPAMFKPMLRLEEVSEGKNLRKMLVYGGEQMQKRSYGEVIPWNKFGIKA